MKKETFLFPVPDMQKKFLLSGFALLKIVLEESDNPLTQAFSVYWNKEKGLSPFYALMDKCKEQKEGANWTFLITEISTLYILLDLTVRIYRAGYYVHLHKIFEEVTGESEHPLEILERSQRQTLEMAEDALNYLDDMKKLEFLATYIWLADRLPDPITGISPLLAAYNHFPKLPKNPPQMLFSAYSNKITFEYDWRTNLEIWVKDLNCIMTILGVLVDIENPPALIISAYFPKLKEELSALVAKLSLKKKRSKIKLTEGEFGLFYACNDLYGRLNASSYYNIMQQLDKNRPLHSPKRLLNEELDNFHKEITKTRLDRDVQYMNETFGDYDVIKDYRRIAGEMVWFDD